MTSIRIKRDDSGRIVSMKALGHAGASREGEYDLVCCAVSILMQTAVNALENVAHIIPACEVDENKGFLEFTLPINLTDTERYSASIILDSIYTGLCGLKDSYPKYIRITE